LTKEGFPTIALVGGIMALLGWWFLQTRALVPALLSGISVLLFLLVLYFFRDPQRVPPQDELAIVAPADGVVLQVERAEEPVFLKGEAVRIAIFLSVLDVHINYVPYSGMVRLLRYFPGKFYRANLPSASAENEHTLIGLDTAYGPMVFKQSSGILARRIVCTLKEGDRVKTGEKFGMIKFGSRMEVYLPAAATAMVKKGDRLRAGESVIAKIHEN
jgi:phosphatidylserine decarboxylase